MKVAFRYKGIPPLDVPNDNLLGEFRPKQVPDSPPTEVLMQRALAAPTGTPQLSSLATPGMEVLLLSDDYTRTTPVSHLLPPVTEELKAAGVKQDDIKILIASGTHRPMTDEELAQKLGEDAVRTYQIWQHHWKKEEDLVRMARPQVASPSSWTATLRKQTWSLGSGTSSLTV